MKKRKYLFAFVSALLSFGILTGCGVDRVDDKEPDPTEEPSEQQQEENEEREEENK